MLKEVFASNIAKLVAACVCPMVGVSAVALKVPPVRSAIHKATTPKAKAPERQARVKPRVRSPIKPAFAPKRDAAEGEGEGDLLKAGLMCPQPVSLDNTPLQPVSYQPLDLPVEISRPPVDNAFRSAGCPTARMAGFTMTNTFAAVPEPATWAQMLAGFALLGGVIRVARRRDKVAAAA